MGYEIQELTRPVAELDEVAAFLADFARDGELPEASAAETDLATWEKRLQNWWLNNPFSQDDTPLGFVLRDPEAKKIVGFQGFIPQDYINGTEIIPGLISTTFFVRESARSAALGMMMRLKRLGQRFHLVDGTPSTEVQAILDRLKFQKTPAGKQHYRIVPLARFAKFGRNQLDGFQLVLDPSEIRSIPFPTDGRLSKHITREGLTWFLKTGSDPSYFVGLCDGEGQLCAYFIAKTLKKYGLLSSRVMESASFDSDGSSLLRLADFASLSPEECGLPRQTSVFAWTSLSGSVHPEWFIHQAWSTHLYYLSPAALSTFDKACQPSEGDSMLL